MAAISARQPTHPLLTDAEVEEFRALVREHAGAELAGSEARALADQLLRALSIIRDVTLRGSSISDCSVDK
jgi:hypothetical protein